MLDSLRERGIGVCVGRPDPGYYDLVAMPCHCPDGFLEGCTYGERIWYSQAVNRFIDDGVFRIEVTGVKGKTSTCHLLAHILAHSGRKVYLRSSRGSGPYGPEGHRIDEQVSIAPPYLLTLPHEGYDVTVCEVSLGGSGKADISCITNLLEDYGIAKNTRRAEEAKKDILNEDVNIILGSEMGIWSKYGKPLRTVGKRVSVTRIPGLGEDLELCMDYGGKHSVRIGGCCLGLQYVEALEMALEVCDAMGIGADDVIRALSTFKGVPGRGEVTEMGGRRCVLERNPGISHMSVERTLETLRAMGALEGAVVIIDPVSKKVCDKLDRDRIEEVVKGFGVDLIITAGDGSMPEIPEGDGPIVRMIKEGYQ